MAVTSKTLRSARQSLSGHPALPRSLHALAYGATLLLAAIAAYVLIGMLVARVTIWVDDARYGYPRTHHLTAFVGHGEEAGQPTRLMAINYDRQVVIVEMPGGNPAQLRAIAGPYLFGADEHLTPVTLALHDMDGDGALDLLLDVRRELIVYLNRDGTFRLPTPEEQATLSQTAAQP